MRTIIYACIFGLVLTVHLNANCAELLTWPGISVSPGLAFPANGDDVFALDFSCTRVSRRRVIGCGVSLGMTEYKSVYGVQIALLNAYAADGDMYALQFGATTFSEYATGLQVGLLTLCDHGDCLAQIGLLNGLVSGFMGNYSTSAYCIQAGLVNFGSQEGIQIGVLNLGDAGLQVGVFNVGDISQIGLFNFGKGLKIGVLNYNGDWLTPVIGL